MHGARVLLKHLLHSVVVQAAYLLLVGIQCHWTVGCGHVLPRVPADCPELILSNKDSASRVCSAVLIIHVVAETNALLLLATLLQLLLQHSKPTCFGSRTNLG